MKKDFLNPCQIIALLLLCLVASGCQALPGQGPLASSIISEASSPLPPRIPSATIFDLITVDTDIARIVSAYQSQPLNRRFGFGTGKGGAVIGVGDQLRVTIFEAGTDGLFSTAESKQTVIDLTVQPDGKAAIPYAGPVSFGGRTLEQARQSILAALQGKAVQPDVIITALATGSRSVTVSGAVNSSGLIPISLAGDQITEAIAKAGGLNAAPYEAYITLVRNKKVGRVLLKSIIENPQENIYIQPRDQIFVTREPRTFTILGEAIANNRVEFGANDLNLLEALALAGGQPDARVDAQGYFIFRYEEPEIVEQILGSKRFSHLLAKGMQADPIGRYPIVYQIDMSRADSLFVGQNFPVANRDVIYIARHPAVDLIKFLSIIQIPVSTASNISHL